MGSYAPRSPDLSAYHSATQQTRQPPPPQPYRSDSFSIPQPSYYSAPSQQPSFPSYQQQQPQQQQPQQQQFQSPSHEYSMAPTFNNNYPQNPYNNGLHTPLVKHEEPPWFPPGGGAAPHTDQKPGRGRGGLPGLKSEQSMIQQLKNEPRVPAPGEAEGIIIRTKFPVARIKRIVQADEDVGKVAQVTPVVVSKALELFMISMTLAAAAEAKARGSKRVTGQHLKQAVQKLDQFDFLSEIVERIPDAPTSKEGKGKGEADDDEDEDEEEVKSKGDKKPRRGRPAAAAPAKRKKRAEREES